MDTFMGSDSSNSENVLPSEKNDIRASSHGDVLPRVTVAQATAKTGTHNSSDIKTDTQKPVSDSQNAGDAQADSKKKKPKKKHNIWWIKASVISLVLAAFFSFLSDLTASAEQIVVIVLLLVFLIMASMLFDAIGVAVTSCDIPPIISMASRKVHGAKTALWLVKNSGTVSSICNDVIGDIFGIISGACSAAIVVKMCISLGESWQRWLTIIISAVVSAATIGGKAFMKNIAISNSKEFVMFVARLLAVFNKDERKIRKHKQNKNSKTAKKKKEAASGVDDMQ